MPNSESVVYSLPAGDHPWGVGDHPRDGRRPSMASLNNLHKANSKRQIIQNKVCKANYTKEIEQFKFHKANFIKQIVKIKVQIKLQKKR